MFKKCELLNTMGASCSRCRRTGASIAVDNTEAQRDKVEEQVREAKRQMVAAEAFLHEMKTKHTKKGVFDAKHREVVGAFHTWQRLCKMHEALVTNLENHQLCLDLDKEAEVVEGMKRSIGPIRELAEVTQRRLKRIEKLEGDDKEAQVVDAYTEAAGQLSDVLKTAAETRVDISNCADESEVTKGIYEALGMEAPGSETDTKHETVALALPTESPLDAVDTLSEKPGAATPRPVKTELDSGSSGASKSRRRGGGGGPSPADSGLLLLRKHTAADESADAELAAAPAPIWTPQRFLRQTQYA